LVITTLTFVLNAKPQDTLVSGFFGLDNALPVLLAGRPGILIDGMPVNFRFPLDSSSLSVTDFEVIDSLGNIHIPMNAVLSPANENGENRTVLLLGEFGTAVTNPPAEVRPINIGSQRPKFCKRNHNICLPKFFQWMLSPFEKECSLQNKPAHWIF
jgi:hypothetical protein